MTPARIFSAQWQLACSTLEAVLQRAQAADRLLQAAFKANRAMGGRDRQRVTTLVYGVLRDLRRLQHLAGSDDAAALCSLYALENQLSDADNLHQLGVQNLEALQARASSVDLRALTDAQRYNVPDAIWQHWQQVHGDAFAAALAQALREQAPVDLRINTLKATRAQVIAALAEAGIAAQAAPYAPHGLRLAARAPLQNLGIYKDGGIEPQDAGSQLLAALVSARAGERIADWCAGAGGKTLALAAAMQNQGTLWALDADATRLNRLPPRLQRAGVECVRISQPADLPHDLDAVLVDAPCSGSGTWRRQPEARLKPLDLPLMAQTQLEILTAAAEHVRVGGRLVYATCSLLADENQAVVHAFLRAHPEFGLRPAHRVLAEQGIDLPGEFLTLYPQVHGTDGFFGAVLVRKK
ncbi:RsmB/NOP family class I SAM-dependent RNA methyltransferase [Sinimarinibacterium sp. NLF-5-8]|uniref:RsmB/NOP family class I SAM-dependent RNA methyltransferase n=1 Tax=Sinimarinibacterium sp. NLF-5-8 TaxID=2698684 RepID=UPI00137BDC8B|nr:RsmB/NOP family class I SAM-dependent RNA methyltransferase [Sinimarinibacterium sp. NLF-5-8]QHS11018.1 RsmB/NOP family class I SAM-dependent RNA methyltransferase [Sinimarinibacterium sp. NLF-5-8]